MWVGSSEGGGKGAEAAVDGNPRWVLVGGKKCCGDGVVVGCVGRRVNKWCGGDGERGDRSWLSGWSRLVGCRVDDRGAFGGETWEEGWVERGGLGLVGGGEGGGKEGFVGDDVRVGVCGVEVVNVAAAV